MDNIKVSVIIPTYNVSPYINETLNSFINQTLKNIQIIVVDDGSTDDTCEIITSYARQDSRIQLIKQENQGAGVARNNGMSYAQGEYIYFFDGDDYCELYFLKEAVKKADETGADITVFDYYRVDQITGKKTLYHGLNQTLLPSDKECFNYQDVPSRILSIVNPTPWNKLYRKSYIEKTGLKFMALTTTNDITFASLSVAMAKSITYIDRPFMYYRINRKEALTTFKQKKLNNVLLAVQEVMNQANKLEYAETIKPSILYFSMSNYIYALNNYAGKFRSKYYRRYYKTLHKIFNSDLFRKCKSSDINNKKLYSQFHDIQSNSYQMKFFKKGKAKISKIVKSKLKAVYPLTMRKFEHFTKKESREQQEISRLNNTVNALRRDIRELQETLCDLPSFLNITGVNAVSRTPRIIVSMTTYPARISTVAAAIESIMNQTVKADKIILWLAKENFPDGISKLPERLLQMQSRGLEIKWTDCDYKSFKKIIPALQEFPDDIIITVDDDLIYDKCMIELLYESYKKYPNAISAMRVHRVMFDTSGNILPYREWVKEDSSFIGVDRIDLMATTGAGTLFPPRILPDETLNWNKIQELCPYADDIWMKIMTVMNGVNTVLVRENRQLVYIADSQEETLWNINCNENDIQLANIIEYYKEADLTSKLLNGKRG